MNRKINNEALEAIRIAWMAGESATGLSERFGVTERHIRRLVAGLERASCTSGTAVEDAVDLHLAAVGELDGLNTVRAETVRALARRLDRSDARTAPHIARLLLNVLDELRGVAPPPDLVGELRRRAAVKLAGLAS